jgi:ubiquinone/menaquinone biosynthesis C-methylase UbiE
MRRRRAREARLGSAVTAIDRSAWKVELARVHGALAGVGNATALAFEDETFDCLVMLPLRESRLELDDSLVEIRRVPTPQGSVVATIGSDSRTHSAPLEIVRARFGEIVRAPLRGALLSRHAEVAEALQAALRAASFRR